MNVYDNMAFGLKLRKVPKEEIRRRVKEAADILGIQELLDRKRQESGDPCLGSEIERSLLEAHLRAIEANILEDPGALESTLVRVKPRYGNADGRRIIPASLGGFRCMHRNWTSDADLF